MYFRLVCCLLIVACSGLMGIERRRRLYARMRNLEMLRDYFRLMKPYITHSGMSFYEVACVIDRDAKKGKFSSILREKTRYSGFADAFSETISMLSASLCLTAEDNEMLCSLAQNVAGNDLDSTVSALQMADERLSLAIDSARMKCETDGRLSLALGFSLGTAAALLLL